MIISTVLKESRKSWHLIVILTLTIGMISIDDMCVAQYHPFPVEDGIWMNNHSEYYVDENNQAIITSSNDYKYCANGNDTIINTVAYKQVDYCYSSGSSYQGAWRYNGGQVYFVPKDSLNEYLLYDFTLDAGSSIDIIFQSYPGEAGYYEIYETYIDYVDTVVVNGTQRRRLYTESYAWIEGIGSTSGLFMETGTNVSNYFRSLVCMSTNDTLHYHDDPLEIGEPGVCDFTVSAEELSQNPRVSQVFPNPARSQMNLNNAEDYDRLSIVDVTGREVASIAVTKGQPTINFSVEDLRNGMYLLRAYSGQQLMNSIRFVKD